MLKRYLSILMLYFALAIMLGHNLIPHYHHFEHNDKAHHHHEHEGLLRQHDSENGDSDWGHIFSNFQHEICGLNFFISNTAVDSHKKKNTQTTNLHSLTVFFEPSIMDILHKLPPYVSDFCNSHYYLPYGLRAPPIFIV